IDGRYKSPRRPERLGDKRLRVGIIIDGEYVNSIEFGQGCSKAKRFGRRVYPSFERGSGMNDHQRKSHTKRRPLIATAAGHVNAPSMKFDQMTDDGEAEADAAVFAGGAAICLTEPFEDVGQKIGRYAKPCIADHDFHVRIDPLQPNLYDAAF